MEKVALITGCSSGIGLHAAQTLAARGGWRVFASARKEEDVNRLRNDGFADVLKLDVDNSVDIQNAMKEVAEKTDGRLDVLFNNAGFGQPGAVEDVGREALQAQFRTNVFGAHELATAAVKLMRQKGGGRIIQNSSVLGFVCLKYRGAYNASKYALEALTDTMRMELADTDVRIILLQPGPIVSHFRRNAADAFTRNINEEDSAHKEIYKQMRAAWSDEKQMKFTLPPDAVSAAFLHAAESPSPKSHYRITVPTVALWYLKRLLPIKWMDAILSRS